MNVLAAEALAADPAGGGVRASGLAELSEPEHATTKLESTSRAMARGTGDRIADGKVKNAPSQLMDVQGDGLFIYLPSRQRELIRQALSEKLPPEYAALIQQYYINLARGKPAAKPMMPEKK